MKITFEEYMARAKSHLYCNMPKERRDVECSYEYTDEQLDENREYFSDCMNEGLSPYKALLFFYEYLMEKENDIDK